MVDEPTDTGKTEPTYDRASLTQDILNLFDAYDLAIPKENPRFLYKSITDFVRKEGSFLSSEPYTSEEEAFLMGLFKGFGYARLRECYRNAGLLVLRTRHDTGIMTVTYGEGIAHSGTIPTEHAVMVLNNKPVDITWRDHFNFRRTYTTPKNLLYRAKYCLANFVYYMVQFPTIYLSKQLIRTESWGVIEWNKELMERGMVVTED